MYIDEYFCFVFILLWIKESLYIYIPATPLYELLFQQSWIWTNLGDAVAILTDYTFYPYIGVKSRAYPYLPFYLDFFHVFV